MYLVSLFCRLAGCQITDKSCVLVASVLQSENILTNLDLSDNVLGDFGVQLICKALSCPKCKLQTLWLVFHIHLNYK